ncbi:UBP1-associated proteins 1C isoform X2 [Neltuma alba]|uniref:UBP1-associated proteins 1C isoform X2 n=1 Tax=Neltuma alba TaxID=207710 RepID=UPI0010A4F40D|nr:UBP1-associated proteins 1C-like isoform X2 [Prosopis alba]
MEFNFRAGDLRTPSFQLPSLVQSHFSDPSLLRGGFPVPNTEQIRNPNAHGDDILRKLEKERIRQEIISGEIARRRMLEEEVRRELMLERELAFRRSLGEKFLLDEQMAIGLNPRLNVIPAYDTRPLGERISFPQTVPQLAQSVKPADPKINMEKLIMLAQPSPEMYRQKRKAVKQDADDDAEHCPVVNKKPKDDWSCELCSVRVTSEKAFNEHLQGKKHKARESAKKRMQKTDTNAGSSSTSKNVEHSPKPIETTVTATTSDLEADVQAQPEVTRVGKDVVEVKTKDEEVVVKIQSTQDAEKQKGTEAEQARIPDAVNKRYKFWCDLCHVGSFSPVVMENHRLGRKHTNRLKRLQRNADSAPSTSAVPKATPSLTKDADGRPHDDCVVVEGFLNGKSCLAA